MRTKLPLKCKAHNLFWDVHPNDPTHFSCLAGCTINTIRSEPLASSVNTQSYPLRTAQDQSSSRYYEIGVTHRALGDFVHQCEMLEGDTECHICRDTREKYAAKKEQAQSSSQVPPEHSQPSTLHLLDIAFDAGKLFEEFLVQAPETAQGSLRHLSLHLQIHPGLRSKFAVILNRLENRARKPERSASQSDLLLEPVDVTDEPVYLGKVEWSKEQLSQILKIKQAIHSLAEHCRKHSILIERHEHEED